MRAASTTSAKADQPFASRAWHFRIDVPRGWTMRHDFKASYLENGAWKTFAAPDSKGTPVLALVVPGSNQITDAEIRIGVSKAAGEVRRCTTVPTGVRAGSVSKQTIHAATFTTFEARDAAMSHHLLVHSYRVVHNHTCYAIDLLVFGTNPEVYDPPATPPFSNAQAFTEMRRAMASFRFTR